MSKPVSPTEQEPEEQVFPETPLAESDQEQPEQQDMPPVEEDHTHVSGYRPENLVQTQPDESAQEQGAEKDDSLLLAEREPDSELQGSSTQEENPSQEEADAASAAAEEPVLAAVEEVAVVQTTSQVLDQPLQVLMAVVGLAACAAAAVAVGILRKRK